MTGLIVIVWVELPDMVVYCAPKIIVLGTNQAVAVQGICRSFYGFRGTIPKQHRVLAVHDSVFMGQDVHGKAALPAIVPMIDRRTA